jgi:glycosyltransferase involved in cell wall biosynthesis
MSSASASPRRVLLVAFHFPPLAGSSGIQRTLRLAQQLPALGWQPLVLSADPRAYERTSDDLAAEVPPGTVVRRAFALDTARQLSFHGRYVGAMARPDRWVSWRFDAVRQGMAMIRQYRPAAIWSTYPIATAHLIGIALHRKSGLPWIADFRDPMAQDGYPADPLTHRQYVQIESDALRHAARSTFTTPGAAAEYARRYPQAAGRIQVVENGYDEASFAGLDALAIAREGPLNPGAITLLHSGIVYPSERDPTQLMVALRRLHDAGAIEPGALKIRFRAAVADELLHRLADQHGVRQYIETCPAMPYRQALAEMLRADALLVMQADNCNAQIPAKVYEYLRAGRPILGLADPAGDTAAVLRRAGLVDLAALESADAIEQALARFLDSLRAGRARLPETQAVRDASRQARSEAMARLLDEVAAAG